MSFLPFPTNFQLVNTRYSTKPLPGLPTQVLNTMDGTGNCPTGAALLANGPYSMDHKMQLNKDIKRYEQGFASQISPSS
jgi:hypothetical protein